MSVGRHCHHNGCNQLDFLPFKCGLCSGIFCLEHRTCSGHECPKGNSYDVSTVICPVCAKAIKLVGDQDPNAAFEAHVSSSACDPSNYARVKQRPRCPAPNCREKLTSTNTYKCKDCCIDVCLKHRFPADHKCSGKQVAAAKQLGPMGRFFNSGNQQQEQRKGTAGGGGGTSSGPSWALFKKKAAAQQEKGQQRQQQQTVIQLPGDGSSGTSHPSSAARPTRATCATAAPASGAPADWHPEPARSGVFAGLYPCPRCTRRFADPVALVAHVGEQHPTASPAPARGIKARA